MTGPLVSVVVPAYNAAKHLAATLNSVVAQTYPYVEVIAVNDGSTDSTREVLRQFEPRIRVIDQANAGQATARNRGVREGRGVFVAFLDSDDLWDPTKLTRQVELLQRFPEAVAVYCDARRIDAAGEVFVRSDSLNRAWHSGQVFWSLVAGRGHNCMTPSQVMVTRPAFDRVGGFPEGIRHCEDYGLWLKLAFEGPFLYDIETLVSYRRHSDSLSVERDSEFRRLDGRFLALLGVRKQVSRLAEPTLMRLYQQELRHAAHTLAWFCRRRGDFHRAADAYRVACEFSSFDLKSQLARMCCQAQALIRVPKGNDKQSQPERRLDADK